MSTLSFEWEVSADNKTRIIDGVCYQHGYQDEVEDENGEMIDNPESKGAFAKRMAKKWVKENVKAYEANLAADGARQTAIDSVEEITIT